MTSDIVIYDKILIVTYDTPGKVGSFNFSFTLPSCLLVCQACRADVYHQWTIWAEMTNWPRMWWFFWPCIAKWWWCNGRDGDEKDHANDDDDNDDDDNGYDDDHNGMVAVDLETRINLRRRETSLTLNVGGGASRFWLLKYFSSVYNRTSISFVLYFNLLVWHRNF